MKCFLILLVALIIPLLDHKSYASDLIIPKTNDEYFLNIVALEAEITRKAITEVVISYGNLWASKAILIACDKQAIADTLTEYELLVSHDLSSVLVKKITDANLSDKDFAIVMMLAMGRANGMIDGMKSGVFFGYNDLREVAERSKDPLFKAKFCSKGTDLAESFMREHEEQLKLLQVIH